MCQLNPAKPLNFDSSTVPAASIDFAAIIPFHRMAVESSTEETGTSSKPHFLSETKGLQSAGKIVAAIACQPPCLPDDAYLAISPTSSQTNWLSAGELLVPTSSERSTVLSVETEQNL